MSRDKAVSALADSFISIIEQFRLVFHFNENTDHSDIMILGMRPEAISKLCLK